MMGGGGEGNEIRSIELKDGQIEARNGEGMKLNDKALGRESTTVKKKRRKYGGGMEGDGMRRYIEKREVVF